MRPQVGEYCVKDTKEEEDVEETDLRLCRIRAELVCGVVLRQSDYRAEVSVSPIGETSLLCALMARSSAYTNLLVPG